MLRFLPGFGPGFRPRRLLGFRPGRLRSINSNLMNLTSAYKANRYPRELVEYMRGHGRRKVLFGSNHPAWPAKDCLEDLDSLGLSPEVTELFLHANAERVFALTK